MQAPKLRPGKDHAVTVDEEVLGAHPALRKDFREVTPRVLRFRGGGNLLLRFGFGLWCFPSDWRGLRRRLPAIQISDATPTFDSDPMLLAHEAFYRTEGVQAQREIEENPPGKGLQSTNQVARNASLE